MSKNKYTYRIVEDGYYIQNNGKDMMEQRGVFAEVIAPGKSYEENAQAHIAQLIEAENITAEPSLEELNRADIDYLFMVMEV